jgi:hypothetical protein
VGDAFKVEIQVATTHCDSSKPLTSNAAILYLVGDEGILFVPISRRLWWLNTTAAFIWGCYQKGTEPQPIASALAERFGISEELALKDTVKTIAEWKSIGLLDVPIHDVQCRVGAQQDFGGAVGSQVFQSPFSAYSERHYRLLDLHVCTRYPSEKTATLVHPVFAHLETDSADARAGLRVLFEIAEERGRYTLLKDGRLVRACQSPAELAPLIQREALLTAYEAAECLVAIHAAAVCKPAQCILMPAAKGSGKSTLTAALLASGYTYLTDELGLLTLGSPHLRPAPVSLGLKRGSWPVLTPVYPILESLPTHVQGNDVSVRYLTPPRDLIASQDTYPVTHVVFPRYNAGKPTLLTPLSHAEALWRIAEGGYAVPGDLDKARVEGLIAWITPLPCYELSVGELGEAIREVERLSA